MNAERIDPRERLHARAAHTIDSVLRRYVGDGSLHAADADDVRSVVMLRLAQRFDDGGAGDVRSLDDYVAQMTHNAARDVFRERNPGRARLHKRVRAILREDERFAVDGGLCSLREHARTPGFEGVSLTPAELGAARSLPADGVIELVLARAGGAIRVERLTELVADALGVPVSGEIMPIDEEELAGADADLETHFIARETLAALWSEIRALPLPQRTALLLHLRDDRGASAIPLLVFTGIATLDEIGAVLEIDRAGMERLWDELPLPDLRIAGMLNTTAARVIGLRRAARERLGRSLRRGGKERA